VHRQQRQL